jgi:dCMP deaminase
MPVPDWDCYFLAICRVVAARSKDPSTQIGCVIVGPAREIRSTGYNSLPRHVRDDVPERFVRPTKYLWIEHAERNAIYNAARCGTQMEGCTLYCDLLPCMDCARAIVQAGIVEIVVDARRVTGYSSGQYDPHFEQAKILLDEAGVKIRAVDPAGAPERAPEGALE